jgi:outer membrane protein insertion porin family
MSRTFRIAAAAALIALFAAVFLSAQEDEAWYLDKTIKSIEFTGVKTADKRDLDGIIKPFVGKKFSDELFLDLQSRIYELDYFETLEPSAIPVEKDPGSVIIRFAVTEKAIIEAVRFEGNSGLKAIDLLAVVTTKAGDLSNKLRLAQDEDAIMALYREKGYSQAAVRGEERKEDKGVAVYFVINEGQEVTVKKVAITGNQAFSEKTLKAGLSLKETGFLQPGAFRSELVDESRLMILKYYKDRGYPDALVSDGSISYETDEKKNRSLATVTFQVQEGKSYQYGGMSFEGNVIFTTDKLNSLVYQKKGVLNDSKFQADLARIRNLYFENGYVFSQITTAESRDEEAGTVSYVVKIVERDRAHISDISIRGNEKTKDKVILREFPLEAGDVFSKKKIEEGMTNLYNLQYFSEIVPDLVPVSEQVVDLILNVKEQSTAGFNFGLSYQPVTGNPAAIPIGGFVKWNDSNFLGNGQRFEINMEGSPSKQSLIFGFTERWLLDTRWLGGVDLSFSHEQKSVAQDVLFPIFNDGVPDPYSSLEEYRAANYVIPADSMMNYDSWSFMLSPATGYLFKTGIGDVGVRLSESNKLENLFYDEAANRPYTADIRKNHDNWLLTDSFTFYTYFDALKPSNFNPGSGIGIANRFSLTGFFPFEAQHFLLDDVKAEVFATLFDIPVSDTWKFKAILGAHSSFTAIFPIPGVPMAVNTGSYPRVDGMMTMRGWTDLQKFDATGIFYNWLELRMPIVEQIAWIDFFLDAGAFQTPSGLLLPGIGGATVQTDRPDLSYLGLDNFAFSAGMDVRFTIPQLPIKIGIAKKFVIQNGALQGAGGDIFKNAADAASGFSLVISLTQPTF